jgi:pyruvate/2-oxoglutarate dehydrogenase complex dihydrolipoamide acyltransferase (E2) component
MLAFARWTLTHSSGWLAGLVGLEVALAPPLLLGLGLAAMNASREAETVAAGELCDDDDADDDGEAEPVWDAEPVGELDADAAADDDDDVDGDADDGEPEAALALGLDGDGEPGVLLEVLPDAGAVGEAEVDEEEGDGDGDGVFVGWTLGVGVGVAVLDAGSTSHLVAVAALALVEVLGLVEAAPAFTVSARAAPGQPASTPRVSDPPAIRLSTAARTYARRMNIALSTLLIEVTVCSLWGSEATG